MTNENTDTFLMIEKCVEEVERRQLNIAGGRSDWVALSYEMATLGEEGRSLFHRCSQLDSSYSFHENDSLFSYALRRGSRTGVGALLCRFRRAGVDVAAIRRETGCSLPNVPISRTTAVYAPSYNFIHPDIVRRLQGKRNTFVDFLSTLFDEAQVAAAVDRYFVGGDSQQRTVFPCIDQEGKCTGGAVVPYLPNGRRDRSKKPSTIHAELKKKDNTFPSQADQVLFGSHLLRLYPSASVGVVEAQKSAVILSIVYPQVIWLATCGKSNFNERLLSSIYDRNVVVYPDVDGIEEWTARASALPFKNIRVSDWWRLAQNEKDDIVDVVLRATEEEKRPYVIPDFITANFNTEAVLSLCRAFQLEIVSTEPQPIRPRPQRKRRVTIMDRMREEGVYV